MTGLEEFLKKATALACQATGFISNDIVFQRVADLEVLILDELLVTEMKE